MSLHTFPLPQEQIISINHKGMVLAFASDSTGAITYGIVDYEQDQEDNQSAEYLYPPKTLPFPTETRDGATGEVKAIEEYADTGGLTMQGPIQAISDGQFVFIFRQSEENQLLMDRYILNAANDPSQRELILNTEVRYQRSRDRFVPKDENDELDYKDIQGNLFIEPTFVFQMVSNFKNQHFTVSLLPTSTPDKMVWQFFHYDLSQELVVNTAIPYLPSTIFPLDEAYTVDSNAVETFSFSVENETIDGMAATVFSEQIDATNDNEELIKIKGMLRFMLVLSLQSGGMVYLNFLVKQTGLLPSLDGSYVATETCIEENSETGICEIEIGPIRPDGITINSLPGNPAIIESANGQVALFFNYTSTEFGLINWDVYEGKWLADGITRHSYEFNGTSGSFVKGGFNNFPQNDLTIVFWIRGYDYNESSMQILGYNPKDGNNFADIDVKGKLDGLDVLIFGEKLPQIGEFQINNDDWQQVAIVRKDGKAGVYIDASAEDTFEDLQANEMFEIAFDPSESLYVGISSPYTTSEFTFQGRIAEVSVWNRALEIDEIVAFSKEELTGTEEELVAYWPFDKLPDEDPDPDDYPYLPEAQTLQEAEAAYEAAEKAYEQASSKPLNINTLTPATAELAAAAAVLKDAEEDFQKAVKEDGGWVYDIEVESDVVLTKIDNPVPFINSASHVSFTEYGWVTSIDPEVPGSIPLAEMRRCYSFIDENGLATLELGKEVGELGLEFMGPATIDSSLIGFVEGAPPVPSENMTEEQDYENSSSISLTEVRETNYLFSASRGTGLNESIEVGAGFSILYGGGVDARIDLKKGWMENVSSGQGAAFTDSLRLGLSGSKETSPAYESVGNRYVPNNKGLAIIKSLKGKMYRLFHKDTGCLVAYSLVPDANGLTIQDIPFELNPAYIQPGVLDGKVGSTTIPDNETYTNELGEISYFRPFEAAELEAKINREEKELEAYYRTYSQGAALDKAYYNVLDGLALGDYALVVDGIPVGDELLDNTSVRNWMVSFAKRSMYNKYQWTYVSSFHGIGTTQQINTKSESSGGGISAMESFGWNAGYDMTFKDLIKSSGGLETSSGSHFELTSIKAKEEAEGYTLDVQVSGEPSGVTEDNPEKVLSYDFSTYYLAAAADHYETFFDTVVNTEWLNSGSTFAQILKQIKDEQSATPVWRVRHIVTDVIRGEND